MLRFRAYLVMLSATVGCASSARPPVRPAPVALPPVENLPPAVQPPVPAPRPSMFAYAPGTYRYEVRNDATVTAVGGNARTDTLATRAVLTYRVTRLDADSIEVQGSVDEFSAKGSRSTPSPEFAQPLPFRFTLTPSGVSAPVRSDSASVCGAPLGALITVAHDLLPSLALPLSNGAQWQDSTKTATCHAMIPVVTRAERAARADWVVVPSDYSATTGEAGYRILRTATGTLAGEGQAAGRHVLVAGTSSTTSASYVNPTTGVLLGGVGDATTRLIVDTGTQRQEFIQQLRQHVRLLH